MAKSYNISNCTLKFRQRGNQMIFAGYCACFSLFLLRIKPPLHDSGRINGTACIKPFFTLIYKIKQICLYSVSSASYSLDFNLYTKMLNN